MGTSIAIEELLNEDESAPLDFKRDQYAFAGASDDAKGELLKDVLALANSWRRADAFILIGVEEVRGGRSNPVGVSHHLAEASLQQFVNSKTQRPLEFSYRIVDVGGKSIGVLVIPVQTRPFFLLKDFGRLKANTVYLRRGSSTDEANPDEIARMGAQSTHPIVPRLTVAATVVNGHIGEIVISVANAPGSAPARNLYLEVTLPPTFLLSQHGLDANNHGITEHGFRLLPQGSPSSVLKFQAASEDVVYPGTSRDVARIQWKGAPDAIPTAVEIAYAVAADEVNLSQGTKKAILRY